MSYFLILLILGLGCYEYYESTILQQRCDEDQRLISDMGNKIDALQLENKKLEDTETRLTSGATNTQPTMAEVTKQTQVVLAEAKPEAAQTPNATAPLPPPSNNLGTIATLDGKAYQNCQLLKVEADGIVISHSEGILKILYGLMPPEMQKKFGYDAKQASSLTEAQIQFQEQQRQAAAQASGN